MWPPSLYSGNQPPVAAPDKPTDFMERRPTWDQSAWKIIRGFTYTRASLVPHCELFTQIPQTSQAGLPKKPLTK